MPHHSDTPGTMIARARQLRKAQTPAEAALWSALRGRRLAGLKFSRQEPIGLCIVDFYCHAHRLAIEVDGAIHDEPDVAAYDHVREDVLAQRGIRVLRLTNDDVLHHLPQALERITSATRPPTIP